jgi:hypothetical protein
MPCHFAHLSLLLTTNNLSESWLSSNTFIQRLTSFHRRCARYAAGHSTERPKQPRRRMDLSTDRYCSWSSGTSLRPIQEDIWGRRDGTCTPFRFRTIDVYRQCLASFPLACTGTNTSERRDLVIVTSGVLLRSALSQSLGVHDMYSF